MPLPMTLFERAGFLWTDEAPAPMLELVAALAARAVGCGVELGVFEALAEGALSRDALAAACGADPVGIGRLADALAATGYLAQVGDGYALTSSSRTWLLRASPRCCADLFPYLEDVLSRWDDLGASVRAGHPVEPGWRWLDRHDGAWSRYHAGLRAVACVVGPEVVGRTRVRPDARTLLDVGGSHGLYTVQFCERHAHLRGTVIDHAHARPEAEATFAASGLGERVRFEAGTLESWTGTADVVLVFNVLRIFSTADLGRVFGRLRELVEPGGQLVVVDEVDGGTVGSFSEANRRLVRLELFNSTTGGVHPADAMRDAIRGAGFQDVRFARLPRAGGMGWFSATRA